MRATVSEARLTVILSLRPQYATLYTIRMLGFFTRHVVCVVSDFVFGFEDGRKNQEQSLTPSAPDTIRSPTPSAPKSDTIRSPGCCQLDPSHPTASGNLRLG